MCDTLNTQLWLSNNGAAATSSSFLRNPPSPLRPLSPLRIPATSVERAIAVLCFIFGGCVYGYVIGAVCGVLSNQDPATQEYKNNMDLLNKYAEEEQLPHHLTVRCREYFM